MIPNQVLFFKFAPPPPDITSAALLPLRDVFLAQLDVQTRQELLLTDNLIPSLHQFVDGPISADITTVEELGLIGRQPEGEAPDQIRSVLGETFEGVQDHVGRDGAGTGRDGDDVGMFGCHELLHVHHG